MLCVFSQGFPFFGVEPTIVDEDGQVIEGPGEGYLVFSRPWPGIMTSLYGDHSRYEDVYFRKFPGYYCTGDGMNLYFKSVDLYCSIYSKRI